MTEISQAALIRSQVARVAAAYAARIAEGADLDLDSIEGWMHGQLQGHAGQEARALAIETGLPEIEVRGAIADALRQHYLARRIAALPPAMRAVATQCQNPTVPVLLGLMERMTSEDRDGMDPLRATRRLYVCTQAQAAVQKRRHGRAGLTTRPGA